jgi:hypothetical protein
MVIMAVFNKFVSNLHAKTLRGSTLILERGGEPSQKPKQNLQWWMHWGRRL